MWLYNKKLNIEITIKYRKLFKVSHKVAQQQKNAKMITQKNQSTKFENCLKFVRVLNTLCLTNGTMQLMQSPERYSEPG